MAAGVVVDISGVVLRFTVETLSFSALLVLCRVYTIIIIIEPKLLLYNFSKQHTCACTPKI